ncbi:hypothetical protein B0H16DRAFT_1892335 [Mycena metata]|uniref:Uncharacterized protein n=1 Tax=Mycena metata TaxID=1033252 RepID=A0AAD7I4M1_9AGAR|nr:hypothetical protein B0H16DRAFT_1892335 [Mycena metata]
MALAQFPLKNMFIVAAWLETCLYGIYFSLFWFSVYINSRWTRNGHRPSQVMFVSSILMFVVATAHVAMSCYRMIRGYVDFRNAPGGPVSFLAVIPDWTHTFNDVLFTLQSLLGDAMAVYRCWILWNRDYRFVILPFCLLLVSLVSGAKVTTSVADASTFKFDTSLRIWITLFFSVAVAQNIITTTLMAVRLWLTEQKSMRFRMGSGAFLPVIRILVESAALYLFLEILLLVFSALNYNVQYILQDAMTPVIGITFGLIMVRIILRAQNQSSHGRARTIGSMALRRIVMDISIPIEDGPDPKMEYGRESENTGIDV